MNNLHPIFGNIFKTTYPQGVFKTPTKKETEEWTPEDENGWGIPDETRDATDYETRREEEWAPDLAPPAEDPNDL